MFLATHNSWKRRSGRVVSSFRHVDPIDSPTTVTVHRILPDGRPLLVKVDLIAARSDPLETILVQPGDIIYLNPDAPWWFRRILDRNLGSLFRLGVIQF